MSADSLDSDAAAEAAADAEAAQAAARLRAQLTLQLDRLPIFPLRRCQLFPGAMLPLYVFEPRYRDLAAACLSSGGAMAIATLVPGPESERDYEGRPPVRPLAGAGVVIAHRKNPDGTYNLLLQGVARVRLLHELPPEHRFREVRAEIVPDVLPAAGLATRELDLSLRTLTALTDKLAGLLVRGGDVLRGLMRALGGPGELADALAAALIDDDAVRLQLLEEPDVAARVDAVTQEVARYLGEVSPENPS